MMRFRSLEEMSGGCPWTGTRVMPGRSTSDMVLHAGLCAQNLLETRQPIATTIFPSILPSPPSPPTLLSMLPTNGDAD
jgi:hypothetical protein